MSNLSIRSFGDWPVHTIYFMCMQLDECTSSQAVLIIRGAPKLPLFYVRLSFLAKTNSMGRRPLQVSS